MPIEQKGKTRPMHRRTFLAALPAAVAAATATRAAPIPLQQLSAYFNAIETAKARFTQSNDDGTQSTGTLYLHRPGRARFEYDPPETALVLAGAGTVAIFDGRSNEVRPEQYPLKRTPLSLILARQVDLARGTMVVGHFEASNSTILALQDPEAPENGKIELVFKDGPTRLAGWIVTDGGGSRTQVVLSDFETGMSFPPSLFSVTRETEKRNR
jgi:outer membrane lipoprotein-sorting protein